MLTKIHPTILALVLLAGCRDPLPCPDCMDVAEDDPDEAEPLPDLPCGGADLLTDNNNCGSCGNECVVSLEGTDLGVWHMCRRKCGADWTQCNDYSGKHENCAEVCAGLDRSCARRAARG